jgi:hypothetical protein
MSASPVALTDEQRRAHFSEMGRAAVEARRQRKAAVARVVEASRKAQSLPPTVTDVEVLERVAALLEGGAGDDRAA